MTNIALPFLTLSDKVIRRSEFLIGEAGKPLNPIGDSLPCWDYAQDVEVFVSLSVDMDKASGELAIPPAELHMTAILHVGTGSGTVARHGWEICRKNIIASEPEANLEAVIPGHLLSGRLDLTLSLVLAHEPTIAARLSPKIPGARLWQCRCEVLLEDGDDARFPVEMVSFSKTFAGRPHSGAPWYVDWRPGSLEADFGGSVRVYVNSDHQMLKQRFVDGDPHTLQAILADVMIQIVGTVVQQEGCESLLDQCGDGSVGQQVRYWIDSAFPGQPMASIAKLMTDRPNEFHASLLALAAVEDAS